MSEEMYKSMLQDAIRALSAIDKALGMPEDGCNSTERTLTAIRLLHAAHRDDVAEIERLRGLLREWFDASDPNIGGSPGSLLERTRAALGTADQPFPVAFCGPFPKCSDDELMLREMLAISYSSAHGGILYGDDGELQLGGYPHPIDFRRDSVAEIRRKIDARGMAKLIEQQRAADREDNDRG